MGWKIMRGIETLLVCLLVMSCGGGDAAGVSQQAVPASVDGIASSGADMTGNVFLKDATGLEKRASIGNGGAFSIAVEGLTGPYLLKAVSSDNQTTCYSFAPIKGNVNVNPFTSIVVAAAAGTADLDRLYQIDYVNQFASLQSAFNDRVAAFHSQMAALYQNFGVTATDFLNGKIEIGKGVDAIFDRVKVTMDKLTNTITLYDADPAKPFMTINRSGNSVIYVSHWENMPANNPRAAFTIAQTISDEAQRTTLAFSGLALMTGNLEAQSFFPPGKVADYTGFQHLRDNDPDNMGHNTSFLTRIANNVIYILNDFQFNQMKALAAVQQDQINLYAYKRFPLMKAFRRLVEGDIALGSTGLNRNAVKKASRELYLLDGQISYDRAALYAAIINSLDENQKTYLDAMKGKGWKSWPDITQTQIDAKMKSLPAGTSVAVMTYASDLFSWYAGSVEADVYFCPERHGTYYGSFYIKDAPAIGHEGYGINEQLTATAGRALSDAAAGYVDSQQATLMSGLVETQRNNLYTGTTNIIKLRTDIATLLRDLITRPDADGSLKNQVLALSQAYGDLDGENNYAYAVVFAQVYQTLTAMQKTKLTALRKSIMSGTYADGTSFDYSVTATPFLYSSAITDMNILISYIGNTDYLFFEP